MTAKQKAARAKFKQVVAEAKKLRKKNPKLTQAQAVKQAWAIEYKKAPRKVAEVGKVKKSAPKKKAAVKKAASKKKAAVKKAAKKSTSYHKDTKSHNVNIRVVSGLPNYKNAVRVYFKNPKYNYTTTVGPNVTEESAKQFFLNKYFNVGVYPKEILQKPTKIKFFRYIDK